MIFFKITKLLNALFNYTGGASYMLENLKYLKKNNEMQNGDPLK